MWAYPGSTDILSIMNDSPWGVPGGKQFGWKYCSKSWEAHNYFETAYLSMPNSESVGESKGSRCKPS